MIVQLKDGNYLIIIVFLFVGMDMLLKVLRNVMTEIQFHLMVVLNANFNVKLVVLSVRKTNAQNVMKININLMFKIKMYLNQPC
ncbi:unnamed protein product [Paramecium pentaurelia]|uniref:Uncharacterized protein n=1 Tax=Paramecium pentaurelia TaxID=43138 RepID=A0A8S1WWC4_9CILI|nr:unnamed protein product [Paramecium pentaurelia]